MRTKRNNRNREKKGGIVQNALKDLAKDALINIAMAKVKERIKGKIKKSKGKGKLITPESIGIMIGKKYLASKTAPKKTREQKIASRAELMGKYLGKGSFALGKAIENIVNKR